MSNDNTSDSRYPSYIIVTAIAVFGAISIAIILKYEITLATALLLVLLWILVAALAMMYRFIKKNPIDIRYYFSYFSCKHGFIKRNDTGITACPRCVSFHFSIWPALAVIGIATASGNPIWVPYHEFLITKLGVIGYLALTAAMISSTTIEKIILGRIWCTESNRVTRAMFALIMTGGAVLGLTYLIQTFTAMKPN